MGKNDQRLTLHKSKPLTEEQLEEYGTLLACGRNAAAEREAFCRRLCGAPDPDKVES